LVSVTNVNEPLAGDYNLNGIVDAADFTFWRDHLGRMFTLPGEDPAAATPGLVDQEDYDFWKANFGNKQPAPAGGSGAIVARTSEEPVAQEHRAPSASAALTTATLSEPETRAAEGSTSLAGFVFHVDRPHSKESQPPRRNRITTIASQDGALVAWLASRRTGATREIVAADLDELARDPASRDSEDETASTLDLAFATLGVW
jgi:hypothetical protein